jgi:cytidylate kinase
MDFKISTIVRRLNIEPEKAEKLIKRQQKLRDNFHRDFLNEDVHDPALYDMLFNNGRIQPARIARTIADFVTAEALASPIPKAVHP